MWVYTGEWRKNNWVVRSRTLTLWAQLMRKSSKKIHVLNLISCPAAALLIGSYWPRPVHNEDKYLKITTNMKSVNLQYNTLGQWDKRLDGQVSDVSSIWCTLSVTYLQYFTWSHSDTAPGIGTNQHTASATTTTNQHSAVNLVSWVVAHSCSSLSIQSSLSLDHCTLADSGFVLDC